MVKRKRCSIPGVGADLPQPTTVPTNVVSAASSMIPPAPAPTRRTSSRRASQAAPANIDTNPNTNEKIEDGPGALRASPDAQPGEPEHRVGKKRKTTASAMAVKHESGVAELADSLGGQPNHSTVSKANLKQDDSLNREDPEVEDDDDANPEELKEVMSRPPPVNSSYLPLPWKGRLGYACLNTYLRYSNPPVFSSRTCRIASILEHRHPLRDPSQPEHATKNRPDKEQPADIARGRAYVEALGLANARDIVKMLRWNDRYGIKFMRLSSEMFPFASHDMYGYKLAPFASATLAEVGLVAAELGHRLTTHPGQFTQLGSPRKEVISASIRDLEYHCELLDLLNLPKQQNRDAVMILHMGGVFGDKEATIARFKENYLKLPQGIKDRLVLENDDVCYSVHDLLPLCEELNIPLVLDFHHHNIVFDADKIREGTRDIMDLYDRIRMTWTRKGITQKMHYSEPLPSAITGRQRRKHSPRVATLPPCAPDMDLMIEAKDKEQAVFELMRTFKLSGFDTFSDMIPHVRNDENRAWKPPKQAKKPSKKRSRISDETHAEEEEDGEHESQEALPPLVIPESEVGMGGPEGRVYWPPGMEEWLRPKKREVKPRDPEKAKTTAQRAALRRAEKAAWQAAQEAAAATVGTEAPSSVAKLEHDQAKSVYEVPKGKKPVRGARASTNTRGKKSAKSVPTPSTSDLASDFNQDDEDEDETGLSMADLTDTEEAFVPPLPVSKAERQAPTRTTGGRQAKRKAVSYVEDDGDD
ncbi:hypothetical protein A1O3_05345 [Capronia epimyces CBS 606.96]|uniref:UV-damage endonuclease n=1 Tax=Capronia epimyces CBS 606.96 TaxID=1182542 RepID=W9Y4U8_9EURO|nr:uncharacterized protein A1O3_05345 [Capronia epimyces CBS 606.96]EXJ84675.1 hypothetical protein A1O3_05345 [Capronia epimyces CBS 606.96]